MKKCKRLVVTTLLALFGTCASFAADDFWTLNASGGRKISDGEWEFHVSVKEDAKEVEVTGVVDKNAAAHLDFSKPIKTADGTEYALVGVRGNGTWFMGSTVETILFPETLRRVDKVFISLPNLTTITPFLPASLDTFEYKSFWNSTALTGDLVVGRDGRPITFLDAGSLFQSTKITSAELGAGVTNIPTSCFSGCTALTNVVFHGAVEEITAGTFTGCSALTNAVLPRMIKKIGDGAFKNCKALKGDFIFEEDVTSVGSGAFENCWSLKSVTFKKSVGTIGSLGGRSWTFSNCSSLTNVTFCGSVESIGGVDFYSCSNMKTFYLANMPKVSGDKTFSSMGKDYELRLFVSKYDEDWKAFMGDASKMTPWDALSANDQKKYTDAYPGEPMPKGLCIAGTNFGYICKAWMFTWVPPGAKQPGFNVILR